MKILYILDPLECLDLEWDTSLYLAREMARRGHKNWIADSGDVWIQNSRLWARASRIHPARDSAFREGPRLARPLDTFHLILIRKDPPFDMNYIYLTYLLEQIAGKVPVVNHPRGIRNSNEKTSVLLFPKCIPETVVTSSVQTILAFQKEIRDDIIVKPLDQKGGKGIQLCKKNGTKKKSIFEALTRHGRKTVMAQRFISGKGVLGDKRILLANGSVLAAFQRRFKRGEFRSNLSLGGTYHPASITRQERAIVRTIKPYLVSEGLLFVGLDVMEGYLLEINVTSPGGLTVAKDLYPQLPLVESLADSLEDFVSAFGKRPAAGRHPPGHNRPPVTPIPSPP